MNVEVKKKIDIDFKEKTVLNQFLNKFNINLYTVLIITLFFIIMIFLNVLWSNSSKKYQILYDHLSNDDRKKIVSHLIHMNIPYRFNEHSGMLLVPENQVYDIRLQLSEQNLPKSSSIGFELLDQEKFGTSQFNEQINYQRALEGELSRTIERLKMITQARVHIALSKSSLFIREIKEPTASVVLQVQPNQSLDREQINAILHLIASSVSGLKTNHITIIDQYGRLLNSTNNLYNELNEVQFKYSESIEKHYKKHIEDILTPILGLNNVYAQVTAQIDFNNQEETEEKYEPNVDTLHQSIRSHQSNNKIVIDEKDIDHAVTNILHHKKNNFKNKSDITLLNRNNNNLQKKNKLHVLTQSQKNHDDTVNYELDHTVLHTKMKIGRIKRLSAAVVVNFIKNSQGDFFPMTKIQINQIKELTCHAIGYSKNRGDSVKVVNYLFVKDTTEKIFHKIVIDKKVENNINKAPILHSSIERFFIWFNVFHDINITMFLF
ncbi:MAG TPA: flagellar basal-body MS-ring/collar protein FliF, partial [Buchnera sp. (in: enterobacteria)]|nr:flagellar basal-body MS-ring/collar protein FliF [Buchnera sp. (in: enterobacteria)]